MKCIKCGASLIDNAAYCHVCGKKQSSESRKALKRTNGTEQSISFRAADEGRGLPQKTRSLLGIL